MRRRRCGEYLAAERAYYDAQTAYLAGLTDELFGQAVARTPSAADDSVAWPLRGYRYWYRTPERAENRQLLRQVRRDAAEAAEPTCCWMRTCSARDRLRRRAASREPSPDDRLLAWSADTSGAEIYQLRFTEIETGQELPDVIERSLSGRRLVQRLRVFLLPRAGRG